jgi:hypothetical protein
MALFKPRKERLKLQRRNLVFCLGSIYFLVNILEASAWKLPYPMNLGLLALGIPLAALTGYILLLNSDADKS